MMTDMPPNVAPLRGEPTTLQPRAQALLSAVTWSADIQPRLERDYIIKDWLDRGAISVVYGASNVGKSFLALDFAHHVSKGLAWSGRRVCQGRVLYVAAEGGATFDNRVAALDGPEFFVLAGALTLTGKNSQARPLSEMIQHLHATGGQPFDLIVVDTLARVMGGQDENAGPDIADLVRNLGQIQKTTGAHVMLVHHSGKDVGRGARGHSSLRAAIDTEIELTRDEMGVITAEVTKQRDGPTGHKFAFTLSQVELGRDQDGDPVTTCLVEPADTAQAGRVAVADTAQKALGVLDKAIKDHGQDASIPQCPEGRYVALEKWRDLCIDSGELSASETRETHLRTFRRVRDQLEKAGAIIVHSDMVWRAE